MKKKVIKKGGYYKRWGKNDDKLWVPSYDRITIPLRRDKMETIDRKFHFTAVSIKSGKKYTQNNAVLFLAKDECLPELLDTYYAICSRRGVDARQLTAIGLLKNRVIAWQKKNFNKVHLPDVEQGKEEKRVCKENITMVVD